MSKITLEFDGIEEADDARTALDGYKWKLAMRDLDQELRAVVKYGNSVLKPGSNEATTEEIEVANKMREKIREILEGYDIQME